MNSSNSRARCTENISLGANSQYVKIVSAFWVYLQLKSCHKFYWRSKYICYNVTDMVLPQIWRFFTSESFPVFSQLTQVGLLKLIISSYKLCLTSMRNISLSFSFLSMISFFNNLSVVMFVPSGTYLLHVLRWDDEMQEEYVTSVSKMVQEIKKKVASSTVSSCFKASLSFLKQMLMKFTMTKCVRIYCQVCLGE